MQKNRGVKSRACVPLSQFEVKTDFLNLFLTVKETILFPFFVESSMDIAI
jgi:hypothetical protein